MSREKIIRFLVSLNNGERFQEADLLYWFLKGRYKTDNLGLLLAINSPAPISYKKQYINEKKDLSGLPPGDLFRSNYDVETRREIESILFQYSDIEAPDPLSYTPVFDEWPPPSLLRAFEELHKEVERMTIHVPDPEGEDDQSPPVEQDFPWRNIVFAVAVVAVLLFICGVIFNAITGPDDEPEPLMLPQPTVEVAEVTRIVEVTRAEATVVVEVSVTAAPVVEPTQLPSPTLEPSPTTIPSATPLPTPTPTQTPFPTEFVLGETATDNRVLLELEDIIYDPVSRGVGSWPFIVKYQFRFKNVSNEDIFLQINRSHASLTDNLGDTHECYLSVGTLGPTGEISRQIKPDNGLQMNVWCGPDRKINTNMEWFRLTIEEFTSIPETTWLAEIPR